MHEVVELDRGLPLVGRQHAVDAGIWPAGMSGANPITRTPGKRRSMAVASVVSWNSVWVTSSEAAKSPRMP